MSVIKCKLLLLTLQANIVRRFYICSSLRNSSRNSEIFDPNLGKNALKLSANDEDKKKLIEIEMNIEKQNGNFFIPDTVPDKHWSQLFQMKNPLERRKFYHYLKLNEMNKIKNKEKKRRIVLKRRAEIEEKRLKNPDHIQYGLGKNAIIPKISLSSMIKHYHNNLYHSILFGQKLVIDLGFEQFMNQKALNSCINQIKMIHGFNRRNKDAYHLHLCNVNMNENLVKQLKLEIPILQNSHPLITLTEKSYLELFPKDKLVYLTSNCKEDLKTYNHDDIYIIGGMVDKSDLGPVSFTKASKENLRMARFPLETHLRWSCGKKDLTIEQVVRILQTMKDTMDWSKAFAHIPKRKIKCKDSIMGMLEKSFFSDKGIQEK